MPKTKQELDDLKAQWKADPCWDLEFTEGFEKYADELRKFQLETEQKAEEEYQSKVEAKARVLNCSNETASYFIRLEYRIEYLEIRKV